MLKIFGTKGGEKILCEKGSKRVDLNKIDLKKLLRKVIVLEGGIGVGKSTAGKAIEQALKSAGIEVRYYPEYVVDSLLKMYLKDREKYAGSFQMIMLIKRISTYLEARNFAERGGVAIVDRSILGDIAFAHMNYKDGKINEEEFSVYLDMVKKDLKETPDITIYLDCTIDQQMERIKTRGNKDEVKAYDRFYLSSLKDAYIEAFNLYERLLPVPYSLNKLYINWTDNIDPNIIIKKIVR